MKSPTKHIQFFFRWFENFSMNNGQSVLLQVSKIFQKQLRYGMLIQKTVHIFIVLSNVIVIIQCEIFFQQKPQKILIFRTETLSTLFFSKYSNVFCTVFQICIEERPYCIYSKISVWNLYSSIFCLLLSTKKRFVWISKSKSSWYCCVRSDVTLHE